MTINLHPIERASRIAAGAVLLALAFTGPENLWFLLGALPLITGLTGFCPPYKLLGFSTHPKKNS